ncbi:MAG TPA: hypothetical protein DDY70_03030 [Clostridiales bacterium]|nr:hypothetical protein [Clostridiales bacterium]
MNFCTEEELFGILESTAPESARYTEADRERVVHNPNLSDLLADAVCAADEIRNMPTISIPFSLFKRFETDGDRSAYEYGENGYFTRRRKLATFGILAWLYRKPEDISALEDILWAVCDEYTWALPAHLGGTGLSRVQTDAQIIDLFAAETGEAMAEILSLVGDLLSPIVVARVRREIRVRIFDRFYENFWWKKGTNNWAAVCAGSCGITAIYEMRDNAELAKFLVSVFDSLNCFLSGFPEDGACLEGVGYWDYGFGYFAAFAETLCRRTEGKVNLFADEKIHRIATFRQKCLFDGGRCLSFSDAGGGARPSLSQISFFGKMYPDFPKPSRAYVSKRFARGGCFRFGLMLRELTRTTDEVLPEKESEIRGTYLLTDAQWYISTAENGTTFAAKGGNNDEPHNHNDIGGFEIFRRGKILLHDVGSGEYNKDYFSAKRYGLFCCSSRGHSVPIVNGIYQAAGKEHAARAVTLREDGMTLDIAVAYTDPTLTALERDFRFDRQNGALTLTDTFRFAETPASVTERFISVAEPELTADGKVTIRSGEETLTVTYDADRLSPKIGTETEVWSTGRKRISYLLDFEVKTPEKEFTLTFDFT